MHTALVLPWFVSSISGRLLTALFVVLFLFSVTAHPAASDALDGGPSQGASEGVAADEAGASTSDVTDLIINEVDYDQPSTDTAEFIEIKNTGTVAVDLSLAELVLVNGSGGGATIYDTITLPSTMLAAGDYFVVCGDMANVANCDLDITPSTNLIQNGAPDAVALRIISSGTLIDAVSYEGCVPGFSEGADPCAPADPTGSGDEDKSISRFPDMTDTDSNTDDFVVKCISPGEANIAQDSNCTTPTGTIIIEKQTLPDGDTATFDFTGDISGTLGDGDTVSLSVTPGTYTSTETVPVGWDLTSIACDDGDSSGDTMTATATFEVAAGETVTCVFTNTKRGTITIVKAATPEDDTAFEFSETITPGTFTLMDPSDNTGVFTDVSPGSYEVTETVPTGWTLESIVCTGDTDGGSDTAGSTVFIDLDPGEDIICTFTNDGPPGFDATKTDALIIDNDGNGEVSPGDVLEYTIEINNTGGIGSNTIFTDTPDANTTLVVGSVTTSQGTVTSGNGGGDTTVEVDLGDVAPGSPAATITFRVTVNDPFPPGVNVISNQGALNASDDPNAPVLTDDPATTAIDDPTDTPIGAASLLTATKNDALRIDNDGDGQADPGDTIRYTVVLTNNGNGGATNIVFTDTPDANTTLVVGSVTTSDGTVDSGNGAGDTDVQVSIPSIAGGGGQVTIIFDVQVNVPFPVSTRLVSNQGFITADGDPGLATDDPATTEVGDPTITEIDIKADLSLTKTADTLTPDYQSEVTFEIIARNDGPAEEASAVVTDVLPPGLTYVSHRTSSGRYDPSTGEWRLGKLRITPPDTLYITARVETVDPVTNIAEVTEASLPDPDSVPDDGQGDDYAAVTITPVAADMAVDKTVIAFSGDRNGPGPADDTVTATFQITVTNNGPSDAAGVFVEDAVPAGATLDSAVPSQGFYDPVTAIWTVGELAVGASATLLMTVTGGGGNNLFNLAEVFADQPDPNLANNLDGAAAQHNRDDPDLFTADLRLSKTVDNPTPRVGDLVTYTIAVTNDGPATTDGVVVSDSLPAGLAFVSATTTSAAGRCSTCGYIDSLGVWIVGHLSKDSSAVLKLTTRVNETGTIVNLAQVLESHLPDLDSVFGDGDPQDDDTDIATITASTNRATAAAREGVGGAEGTPARTELGKNYPNPFNPETVIPFAIPEGQHVTVEIYNLLGQRIAVLLDQPMADGRHTVTWQARNQPSGLYLVRLQAGKVQKIRRMTLVR